MLRRRQQLHTKLHKLIDACLFGLAFWLAHALRALDIFDRDQLIKDFNYYAWLLLVIVPLAPPLLEVQGFYRRPTFGSRRQIIWQILKASAWLSLTVITVLFFVKSEGARGVIALYIPCALLLAYTKEEIVRWWAHRGIGREQSRRRIILVGNESDTEELERTLKLSELGHVLIVDRINISDTTLDRLSDLLHRHSANAVMISPRNTLFGTIEQVIQLCELEGVEVLLLANFFQTRISQTTVDEMHGLPLLVFRTGPEAPWQTMAKTLMDFFGALLLLILLSPVILLTALAVRKTSPGPVLFRQQRAGLNGRPFTMLKFRSMVSNAEQLKQELEQLNEMTGPVFKVSNDPRITPVGRFIRKWSIDELPQLINVLRGEMSLVGPRPLPLDEVARFDDLAHRRRLSVKPGLTCLWQVSGRNEVRDFQEWVRLDLEYIDNWSLWLDLKILVRTIPAVITGAGAK